MEDGVGGVAKDLDGVSCGMTCLSKAGISEDGSCGVTKPLCVGADATTVVSWFAEVVVNDGIAPVLPATGATQDTALPPLAPEQVHVHGPLPLTVPVMPDEHNPLCGLTKVDTPLAAPHTPSTGAGGSKGAVQLTLMPPFCPRQLQFHGPFPAMLVAVPLEQSPSTGADVAVAPLANPHRPLATGPGA
jgi:hypothetical protein